VLPHEAKEWGISAVSPSAVTPNPALIGDGGANQQYTRTAQPVCPNMGVARSTEDVVRGPSGGSSCHVPIRVSQNGTVWRGKRSFLSVSSNGTCPVTGRFCGMSARGLGWWELRSVPNLCIYASNFSFLFPHIKSLYSETPGYIFRGIF